MLMGTHCITTRGDSGHLVRGQAMLLGGRTCRVGPDGGHVDQAEALGRQPEHLHEGRGAEAWPDRALAYSCSRERPQGMAAVGHDLLCQLNTAAAGSVHREWQL